MGRARDKRPARREGKPREGNGPRQAKKKKLAPVVGLEQDDVDDALWAIRGGGLGLAGRGNANCKLPADLIQMQFQHGDNLRFAPFNPISAKVASQY